jgi:hypothetical protein
LIKIFELSREPVSLKGLRTPAIFVQSVTQMVCFSSGFKKASRQQGRFLVRPVLQAGGNQIEGK